MKEITTEELKNIQGGYLWIGAIWFLVECVDDAISNPDDFEKGFNLLYSH